MLERFLKRTDFSSLEDFKNNFEIVAPENFNFAYDVVDAWAAKEPDKLAMLWTNDEGALDVPEDELMSRLIKRGQESGRADDNEETIQKRLVVYHSQTAPLIDWYKTDGKYQHINGLGTMEGIFAEIAEAIDKI